MFHVKLLLCRFQTDTNEFLSRVGVAVRASLDRVYDAPADPGNTLIFTEPKPAHDDVIKKVLYKVAPHHHPSSTNPLSPDGSSTGAGRDRRPQDTPGSAGIDGGSGGVLRSGGSSSDSIRLLRDDNEDDAGDAVSSAVDRLAAVTLEEEEPTTSTPVPNVSTESN
jgi:hypothetical protein